MPTNMRLGISLVAAVVHADVVHSGWQASAVAYFSCSVSTETVAFSIYICSFIQSESNDGLESSS
jgi:hypothetical protein